MEELEAAAREPIAIVGMGMRFPGGVNDAGSFWELLRTGKDAVTEIPADRWKVDDFFAEDPGAPGRCTRGMEDSFRTSTCSTRLFSASPGAKRRRWTRNNESCWMWWKLSKTRDRTLSVSPEAKRVCSWRSATATTRDWCSRMFPTSMLYSSTGTNFSVASGRLSFFLGLCGPSMSIDTACSGSLVGVHLGCRLLRLRECNMALAGGVNLILTPELNINFCKARMMSPDGRCRTFDAGASGRAGSAAKAAAWWC